MKVGTKSLLFGVHQFLYHPLTVTLAWKELYKSWPTWKEFICIFIHDWGYWGCPNMDGKEGEKHPELACIIACKLFPTQNKKDNYYGQLCLLHSRHYARKWNLSPSNLCWADKLCYKYDPVWFYTLRAKLSGEIKEYRALLQSQNFKGSDSDWYREQRKLYIKLALSQKADTIPYQDVSN
jgi:hypothetical protein